MKTFITDEIRDTLRTVWNLDVREVGTSMRIVLCSLKKEYLCRGTNNIASAVYYIENEANLKEKSTAYTYGPIDEHYCGCTAIVTFEEPQSQVHNNPFQVLGSE